MQLDLKPEGKIYKLIQSGEEFTLETPLFVGDVACIFKTKQDNAWHLRISLNKDLEKNLVIPDSAFTSKENMDKWVLVTIAREGLNMMRERW